jgi:hypothetical protein
VNSGQPREFLPTGRFYMPDDLVVVRFLDADEAGDYRVMRHGDAFENPDYEITDMDAEEFLSD